MLPWELSNDTLYRTKLSESSIFIIFYNPCIIIFCLEKKNLKVIRELFKSAK